VTVEPADIDPNTTRSPATSPLMTIFAPMSSPARFCLGDGGEVGVRQTALGPDEHGARARHNI